MVDPRRWHANHGGKFTTVLKPPAAVANLPLGREQPTERPSHAPHSQPAAHRLYAAVHVKQAVGLAGVDVGQVEARAIEGCRAVHGPMIARERHRKAESGHQLARASPGGSTNSPQVLTASCRGNGSWPRGWTSTGTGTTTWGVQRVRCPPL